MTTASEQQHVRSPRAYYVGAVVVAVGTALFLVLSAGALGIIGSGGRPDLMYVGVLVVLVLGSVVARLRARGMAVVLLVTAMGPLVVAGIALATGLHRTEGASALDIVALSGMFAAMFGCSAWLFRRAAG